MLIYQLVFISILGFHFRNESISIENTTSSLLCCRQLSKRCISKLSVAVYYKQNRSTSQPIKRSYGCLQQFLFIISGTVEINPEPTRLKYACGQCNHAVKNPENLIACDSCSKWYHKDCLSMGDQVFDCYAKNENLEWICMNCALNNISNPVFDSSISSNASDVPPENIQRKKSKISAHINN